MISKHQTCDMNFMIDAILGFTTILLEEYNELPDETRLDYIQMVTIFEKNI